MSDSFELRAPDVVTTTAVGPPGQRVFFLQARQGTDVVTLRLEKQQVAALAEYLAGMVADLAPTLGGEPVDLTVMPLLEPAWVVASLAVAYQEQDDRILLVAEELLEDELADGATARFWLSRAQATAFSDHARVLVASGRPPCQLCGRPLDPTGHQCPRWN